MAAASPAKQQRSELKIELVGIPDITYAAQALQWYHEEDDVYFYIFAGVGFNPLNSTYKSIVVLHLSMGATQQMLKQSKAFFLRSPRLTNEKALKRLEKLNEELMTQLGGLTESFEVFHVNALRMSANALGAEITGYYISQNNLIEFAQGRARRITPEPTIRLTVGLETLFFFISQIRNTEKLIEEMILPDVAEVKNEAI